MFITKKIFVCTLQKLEDIELKDDRLHFIFNEKKRYILAKKVDEYAFKDIIYGDLYPISDSRNICAKELITEFKNLTIDKKIITTKEMLYLDETLKNISEYGEAFILK